MELYQQYEIQLFNEKIFRTFLNDLWNKDNLSDRTVKHYYNSVLDFDLYLVFIQKNWDNVSNDDFELFKRILKRMNLDNRGLKLRLTHIKRFKEYYDTNKFKEEFI